LTVQSKIGLMTTLWQRVFRDKKITVFTGPGLNSWFIKTGFRRETIIFAAHHFKTPSSLRAATTGSPLSRWM